MKKIRYSAALMLAVILLPMVALASDISGALFFGNIVVSNNGTATGNISTNLTLDTDNLIADDFLNASANNTVITNASGADIPFMPGWNGNDWAIWVAQIGANTFLTNILYTANSTGGEIRYFPGSGGMTIADAAGMEPSDNFSFQLSNTWIDTDSVGDNITLKEDAFRTWINATENISAGIQGHLSIQADTNPAGNSGMVGQNVVYLTAHDQANATALAANLHVGQSLGFNVWRPAVYFDTSELPDDAVVISAVLHYRGSVDLSAADFNITIQNGQPTFPSDPLVVGDFLYTQYSGDGGSFNTAAFIVGDNPIQLSEEGLGWISTTGTTKFILRSDEDINSSAPAGNEYVQGTVANTSLEVFYTELTAAGITEGEYELDVSIKDDPGLDSYASGADIGVSMGSGILPVRILEKITLAAPAASVTFDSISGNVTLWDSLAGVTSRHLVVMVNAASDEVADSRDVNLQFNGDGGANYNWQRINGIAAAAAALRSTGVTSIQTGAIPGTNYANAFGGGTILIPHAFNTSNHKATISLTGAAEERVTTTVGRWADTSAITSANLYPDAGNFVTGSTFILGVVDERYLVEEQQPDGASVTFNAIPQDGHDLVAIGYLRTARAGADDGFRLYFNADEVAGNYFRQWLYGAGAVAASNTANNAYIGQTAGNNATAGAFGVMVTTISQYAEGTNQPHFLSLYGYHESTGATSLTGVTSGRRTNVAAITAVKFRGETNPNFVAGSLFSLYRVPRYLIDRQELTAPAATITFNNIPQGYEALQLSVYARSSVAAVFETVDQTLNGDAVAANYDFQLLQGSGAVVTAARNPANRYVVEITGNTAGANEFGGGIITYNQYSSTVGHKHSISIEGRNENTANIFSRRWEDTSAITSIVLTPRVGNFMAGSVFELVGVMPTSSFMIEIDGDVEAIEAAGTATVVDNASDWVIGGATPYIEQYEHYVGGNLLSDISWEYAATFTDASGNGNDATPTFRTASMDADVVATLTSFTPVSTAEAPDFTMADSIPFIEGTGNVTGNFTTIPATGGFPLAGVITAVANATSTPAQLPLMMIAVFVILTCSLSYSGFTRRFGSGSIFGKAFVILALMGIFIAIGNFGFDFWMVVSTAILLVALSMASRQQSWQ